MGAEQGLEHDLLVAGREPVERLGVLADVVVHPHERLVAHLAEGHDRRGRHDHDVADAPDLEDDLARPREQPPRATRSSPAPGGTRLRRGA